MFVKIAPMQTFVTMHDQFPCLRIVIFVNVGPVHYFVTIFNIRPKRGKLSASLPSLGRLPPSSSLLRSERPVLPFQKVNDQFVLLAYSGGTGRGSTVCPLRVTTLDNPRPPLSPHRRMLPHLPVLIRARCTR